MNAPHSKPPLAIAVAGALADLSPFPRLGALALAPMPQGGVIRFKLELSHLRGTVLDLQCGAYMPADQLAALLRHTADRIETICYDNPQLDPTNQPDRASPPISLDPANTSPTAAPQPNRAPPTPPR